MASRRKSDVVCAWLWRVDMNTGELLRISHADRMRLVDAFSRAGFFGSLSVGEVTKVEQGQRKMLIREVSRRPRKVRR